MVSSSLVRRCAAWFLVASLWILPAAQTAQSVVEALRSKDNDRALRLAQDLAASQPSDPRAWVLQGIALQALERSQESLEAFEHALQIDPHNVAALEGVAQVEFQAGSPHAVAFLDRLLQLHPEDQTSHAMMAALAYQRKDCPMVVEHYQKSARLVAGNIAALSQFGACLFRLNRAEEAIAAFQTIVELRPGDADALVNLAVAQRRALHYDDAIRTLQRTESLGLLAAVFEENQQTPQAVETLQKAIRLAPANIDNYLDLATLSLNHGAFQTGVDVVNAGLQAAPDSAPLYLERGVLEVQMEQYEEANADFRKAAALNPLDDNTSLALGISLLQENKVEESLQIVKQRLAIEPADPTLNYLLAELLIRQGVQPGTASFQEAKAAAQSAVHSKPDFALAADVLTELYLRSGEVASAEETARLALKSDPNDRSAVYNLIACLRKKGDRTELPLLVQKLADITADLRRQEEGRSRFKLVENAAEAPKKK